VTATRVQSDTTHGGVADATRERLVRAAANVLSQRGYSQARLQEIAEVAELKAPAVYYHFPSRDALITAALRDGQVLVREHVLHALTQLPPESGPRDRVLAAVESHLRIELELSDLASAVVRTSGHVPPHIRAEIDTEVTAYYDVWRQLLADAADAGALRPGLDHSVARMLVMGALNWATEWRSPTATVDAVVANARVLVNGALFNP
jgi:TetR/AcrR family transcriptional regulator, cholesterol catabolism regulator